MPRWIRTRSREVGKEIPDRSGFRKSRWPPEQIAQHDTEPALGSAREEDEKRKDGKVQKLFTLRASAEAVWCLTGLFFI